MSRVGIAAVALAIVVCTTAIFFLANSVRQEIDALATVNSDTTQWSLAQTEVDLMALQIAVDDALIGESTSLSDVRRRFDIFYSRVNTIIESQQFAELRRQNNSEVELAALRDFLDRNVSIVDGGDEGLRAALPALAQDISDLRTRARAFSLSGLRMFAAASDAQRNAVALLLTQIGLLTLALVAMLMIFVVVLLVMIRQSARTQRAVDSARNRLQEMISTSIDGILVVGKDGRIIDYNGAAERIFGHSREEALGQDMADLIVPDHMRKAHDAGMQRYRETGEMRVVGHGLVRLAAKRKDGTVFPVDVTISSASAYGKEVFVSYLRDVSAQVAAEQELVDARDKAVAGEKAKAQLLAVMSHEMRTPLNGLLGTMELMDDTKLTAHQRRYLAAMNTSANLLLHHVNDVLSISRAEARQLNLMPSDIKLAEMIDALVESQRQSIQSNGNTITCDLSNGPAMMRADRTRLNQVILNLLGNANKFTRNGDIVLECEALSDGKHVEFRVIDNGIGIAEEDQEAIFEDFRTLDSSYGRTAEGTGLGLAISKRLVEAMGGEIGVESEAGEGSLFWVRLPIGVTAEDSSPERAHASPAGHADGAESRPLDILLVEDNKVNRLVARDMLEKGGHRVTEAHDGREGIHMAAQKRYDLILMDISMPEVDGITATMAIRSSDGPNHAAPIVALTAHALPEDLERFKAAGVNDTLVKPLTRKALAQVLGDVAGAAQRTDTSETEVVLSALRAQVGPQETLALLDQFIAENSALAQSLANPPAETEARKTLAAEAHRVAGSAGVFQMVALHGSLKQVETALRQDDTWALDEARTAYGTSWRETRGALDALRERFAEVTT